MNYLDELKGFGLPTMLQNARAKHYIMYDRLTVASGTTQYNLFVSDSLSSLTRNRKLPISNNEIVAIKKINATLNGAIDPGTVGNLEIFNRAYLQILVDDREKLKIPFVEFLNFRRRVQLVAASAGDSYKNEERTRTLVFPIVLNSSSNVQIRVEMPSGSATAYNGATIDFEFEGVKYDKLSNYSIDLRKDSPFERLSYSMYQVNQITYGAATTYELFASRDKAVTDFSKSFPLGDKEAFSIENIEIASFVKGTTPSEFAAFLVALKQSVLKIWVDDVEFFNYRGKDMHTVLVGPGATDLVSEYYTNKGLTLITPLTVPANSRVKVSLETPSLTLTGNGTTYFNAILKGTLQRTVA